MAVPSPTCLVHTLSPKLFWVTVTDSLLHFTSYGMRPTLMVRSADPVQNHSLAGSTATERTQPRWPDTTRYSFQGACHTGRGQREPSRRLMAAELCARHSKRLSRGSKAERLAGTHTHTYAAHDVTALPNCTPTTHRAATYHPHFFHIHMHTRPSAQCPPVPAILARMTTGYLHPATVPTCSRCP